jgi:[ribosomal protein S18]-alanine N-acetyltransferase
MTEASLLLSNGSHPDLRGVMTVMDDSFDPRFGEAWTHGQVAGLLPMPGVWLTLAREGDEVLGFTMARVVADEAELLLLAVRAAGQRRGIGRTLLAQFEDEAVARGAIRLHLEVREGNHALNLYQQAGFELVGRRRDYYHGQKGDRYDALTLAKRAENLR